jgi:hypothetical protein
MVITAILLMIIIDDQIFIGVPIKKNRYLRLSLIMIGILYYIFGVSWTNTVSINPVVNPF